MKAILCTTLFLFLFWGASCSPPSEIEEKSANPWLLTYEDIYDYVNCNITGPTCMRDCDGLEDGYYQFCGNCTYFLVCENQQTSFGECVGDLKWDDAATACKEQSATCRECFVKPLCDATGPDCISSCENMPDNIYQDCHTCENYIECNGGYLTLHACPEGQVFNSHEPRGCANESDSCVECYEIADCESTGPSCITTCEGKDDGVYQSCRLCIGYVLCVGGQADQYLCSIGKYWDDNRVGCYETSETCAECEVPDMCRTTGEACEDRCIGLVDGFYQACANCSSYLECTSGTVKYHKCEPDGWYYDATARACFRNSTTCEECETYGSVAFDGEASDDLDELGLVTFDEVTANLGDQFDGTFYEAKANHVHFFSMNAGVKVGTKLDVYLNNDKFPVSLFRKSISHNGVDAAFRNYLTTMTKWQRMSFHTAGALNDMTSWNGFDLEGTFKRKLAFFVTRNSAFEGTGSPVLFTDERINLGSAFDLASSTFKAPFAGYYYFTYSAGLASGAQGSVRLEIDGKDKVELAMEDNSHNDVTMNSRSMLVKMLAGSTARLVLHEGSIHSDSQHSQTSFSGFLYEPEMSPTYAWSVHRNLPLQAETVNIDPIGFWLEDINDEGVFDTSTHTVTIPLTGYYFIEFNMAAFEKKSITVDLLLNGDAEDVSNPGSVIAQIDQSTTSHAGTKAVGKSLIRKLNRKDTLRLRLHANTYLYSNELVQGSFMGFLLYSTV